MDYISAEEFLKQPEEVQDVFKTWLEDNLNVHDWVKLIEEDEILWVDSAMDTRKDDINVGRVFYLGRCMCWSSIYDPNVIPLLTETQLRKFIEEKTGCIAETRYYNKTGYDIWIHDDRHEKRFIKLGYDLLQAYWIVACKIAEEVE